MIINYDVVKYLAETDYRWDTIFADIPDNIGLPYEGVEDNMSSQDYGDLVTNVIKLGTARCQWLWVSFNAKHTTLVGHITYLLPDVICKPCVQTFTFGQNRRSDLGNGHRPLWRFTRHKKAKLFPDAVRIQSWRQKNGDKRANPAGAVPLDVFTFPRVTGNSRQRRKWHPTQLHEGLVDRCVKLTTPPGGKVLDAFSGTGTTRRVAKRLGFDVTSVELSETYFQKLLEEEENLERPNGC